MWEPVAIPFQNSQAVPTLPTVDEIRACTNVLTEPLGLKVVAVNDEVVVKYGYRAHDYEGQALVYLERHVPEVPASRLYAMYYDAGEFFLVMQRIPGVQMDLIWPH
ncbi:hypothetical protein N7466_000279 [Penicillium verhagenii]|uniref:uncharacterized protein n=1 Tax=Penicillium verhagenii TaxID=1562060 RepID=UPI0025450C40|nr:uncharacterized protein N7466_000279 [Penicillium verhagenii]KAJ5947264.1 hypothetical protein N7466_000279 [Penicillium verhagenii]